MMIIYALLSIFDPFDAVLSRTEPRKSVLDIDLEIE